MKEKTKFVAFSTQKGGAGKTTLTVLAASYLHYVKGFNVAVIDCDYPQHSIVEMRERDLKLALEDEHYKRLAYEQFTRLQKKAYPVVESNTKEALADADYLLPQGDFDYVFFDLPGTINNEDLIHSLAGMDYLVADQCRPGCHGKHPELRGCGKGAYHGPREVPDERAVYAMEHGGRT